VHRDDESGLALLAQNALADMRGRDMVQLSALRTGTVQGTPAGSRRQQMEDWRVNESDIRRNLGAATFLEAAASRSVI
jgi:hypothetical protein